MSVLTVGSMAIDFIETPYGKADAIVGGANPFISIAASHFTDVRLVSVVGGDFPESFLEYLKGRDIDLDGLQIKPDRESFSWTGRYHADMNGRDTLDTKLNVLGDFDPVLPASYLDSQYVMLGNLMPGVQQRVLEQLPKRPKVAVLDTMNFWMTPDYIDGLKQVIAMSDVLTINDEEARLLTGERSLVKAASKIHDMGVPFLVIKKGEHGALLFHAGQTFYAPALPLEDVVDPTGAGDTFAGGFIGYLAQTGEITFENMKRALICGSAMASFCVEKFGTEGLKGLNKERIRKRMAAFESLVKYDLVW